MILEYTSCTAILDAMVKTGVYVLEEDSRKLLYLNKRACKISPEAKPGSPCPPALTALLGPGVTAEGPLPEGIRTGYSERWGGVVDVSTVKIPWEDRVPAFMISVELRMDAVGYAYRKILRVDLDRDRCDVLLSDPESWQPERDSLSHVLGQFARSGAVHPEDVDRFTDFTRLERLRQAAGAESAPALLYRRRMEEAYHWSLMEVIPSPEEEGRFALLCIKDVHNVLQEGLALSQTERDVRMAAILKSRYQMMNTVYLETGLCERVRLNQSPGADDVLTGDYASYIQNALDRHVHPGDAGKFRALLSLEHLRERAETIEDYGEDICQYRVRGEDPRWIELHILYSRQKGRVMVNILGQDITREKREEEVHTKTLEDRAYMITSLSSLFFSTYYIDLERDAFRAVTQQHRVTDVLGDEVNFTNALALYATHFIHPDDREEYLRVMSVDHLRETLRWWQPYTAVEYRKLPDFPELGDTCQLVRATAIMAQTGPDDMPKTVVYVARDITSEKPPNAV